MSILKHPKPFYIIFFTEAWERFGYYGMQSLLVIYLSHKMKMNDSQSFNTFSAFTAMIYALVSVGGYIGDHILGTKRTLILGGIILSIGYAILSMNNSSLLYISMGIICVGNSLFKANPSNLLAKCYSKNDHRIDGAFTLYYMSINLGSLISMILAPIIAEKYGWNYGFLLCSVGLLIAIINFLIFYKLMRNVGSLVDINPISYIKIIAIILASILIAFFCSYILKHLFIAHFLLFLANIVILIIFSLEIIRSNHQDKKKLLVSFILMLEAVVFFVLYQQMPTSLNFFAINNVENKIFGIEINPLIFQALNPFWIFLVSPILAWLYNFYGRKNQDFSIPIKFTIGMFLCSLSFLCLYICKFFSSSQGIVNSYWIIISYLFQSIGELLVSGLGLAMIAKLVPERLMGFSMGAWFMTTSIASIFGGFVASMTHIPKLLINKVITLKIYTHVFLEIGISTLLITIVMLFLSPVLNRMINEKNK